MNSVSGGLYISACALGGYTMFTSVDNGKLAYAILTGMMFIASALSLTKSSNE